MQMKRINQPNKGFTPEEQLLYLLETKQFAKYEKLLVKTYHIDPLVTYPERKGTKQMHNSHCSDRVVNLDVATTRDEDLVIPIVPDKYEVIDD